MMKIILLIALLQLSDGIRVPLVRTTGSSAKSVFAGDGPIVINGSITDHGHFFYTVQFDVGTPPQALVIDTDTGSSDTWFFGEDCDNCHYGPRFKPGSSSTFKKYPKQSHFHDSYGSGSVKGTVGQDVIKIGNQSVGQQLIGLATHVHGFGREPDGVFGLLGLGRRFLNSIGVGADKIPFVQQAHKNNQIKEPVFSYYIKSNSNASIHDKVEGELVIGEIDSTRFTGPIRWHHVTKRGFWAVESKGMKVNGKSIEFDNNNMILDTGTTVMMLEDTIYEQIAAAFNVTPPAPGHLAVVDCNIPNPPIVSFTIGGVDYPMSPNSYAIRTGENTCGFAYLGGFTSIFGGVLAGDPFIRSYFHAFHYGNATHKAMVGLAKPTP